MISNKYYISILLEKGCLASDTGNSYFVWAKYLPP